MWFQPGPHHVPPCGHMWKIRSGPDRNFETSWAISARAWAMRKRRILDKSKNKWASRVNKFLPRGANKSISYRFIYIYYIYYSIVYYRIYIQYIYGVFHGKADGIRTPLSKSESVEFLLIKSAICLFTDSSVKKYFSLLNQLIFTEILSEIWLIYSNLFLAIWISQISLIISRFWLI